MKINTQRHDVDANGMMNQRKFTVDAGAHIMAVLSGLYKNPVDAMVREYLTNMYDAYVALQRLRPDSAVVPPVLHLPTALDGNLTFRDYGIGMSLETVWNVYATYGASTKNGNNDEVGGFGLGSKTAFCYNGGASWTIESRYDGEKHIFMAFIGEDGVPNLSHVTTMPTDEHNGLTISIPIRREDHHAAYDAAKRYVPYFPMTLTVEGDTIPSVEYTVRGQSWGIRKDYSNYRRRPSSMNVIMGNVPYSVDFRTLGSLGNSSYDVRDFLGYNNIDLWVNIGDVDIVPSRDDLKYTDRTKAAIKKSLDVMLKEIGVEIGKQLDACDTEWAAIKAFHNMTTIRVLHAVCQKLTWRGIVIGTSAVAVKREDITKADPSFTAVRYAITSTDRASVEITENPDMMSLSPIQDNTFLIVDDMPKGGATVARALIYQKLVNKSGNGRTHRYGHTVGHAYLVKTKLPHDKLAALFGGAPADVVKLSSVLKGVVPITQAAKATKDTIYRWSGTSWDARVNIPTGTKFYYLPLTKDNYTGRFSFVNNRYGAQKDAIASIHKSATALGFDTSVIYGIKSDDVKNFDSSWINLVEVMEAEITKRIKADANVFALSRVNISAWHRTASEVFVSTGITNMVTEAVELITAMQKINAAKSHASVTTAYSLCDKIPNIAIAKEIETAVNGIVLPDLDKMTKTVLDKYPMLGVIMGLSGSSYFGNERMELLKKNSQTVLAYIAQNA